MVSMRGARMLWVWKQYDEVIDLSQSNKVSKSGQSECSGLGLHMQNT